MNIERLAQAMDKLDALDATGTFSIGSMRKFPAMTAAREVVNAPRMWRCEGMQEMWDEKPDDRVAAASFHSHTNCGWVRIIREAG